MEDERDADYFAANDRSKDAGRALHMNRELTEILSEYLAMREMLFNSWMTQALFVSQKGNRLAIRAMEENLKLPLIVHVKELIKTGALNLKFQKLSNCDEKISCKNHPSIAY